MSNNDYHKTIRYSLWPLINDNFHC